MGLWDKIKGEFVDIIEWIDDSNDTLVHRFERYDHEIKYGAQLVVREAQTAIFVNEGQLADVYQPGTHTLETQNMPILTTLKGWKYGFHSPFKAEVYFVSTRQFTDQKWGTKNPIMMRDAEFGAVRIRAFGTYAFRAKDPKVLLREIVGVDGHFTLEEITNQLRNIAVSRFADRVAESKIPVLDLAANYDELGRVMSEQISPEFEQYGLDLTTFLVENISLPPAVEKAMDKRTSMGVVGDLNAYAKFQSAEAMEKAAENTGAAGGGMAMGMGMMMGQNMGQNIDRATGSAAGPGPAGGGATPPPLPTAVFYAQINGQQAGPFDIAALGQRIQAGQVTGDSLVWKQGMPRWAPASQVPEVLELLAGSTPPPLPPSPPSTG